eukprot:jgi/Bigna1/87866/estExt_fgenesh1_pg.C_250072
MQNLRGIPVFMTCYHLALHFDLDLGVPLRSIQKSPTCGQKKHTTSKNQVGDHADVRDTVQKWLVAEVKDKKEQSGQSMLKVHYIGYDCFSVCRYDDKWDEWINIEENSDRFAKLGSKASIPDSLRDSHGKTCRNGHQLKQFDAPHASYVCDVCKKSAKLHETLFGCRKCDYDECNDCYQKSPQKDNAEGHENIGPGDIVEFQCGDGDVSRAVQRGAPGTFLSFSKGVKVTINSISGDYFTETRFTSLWAPKEVVKLVKKATAGAASDNGSKPSSTIIIVDGAEDIRKVNGKYVCAGTRNGKACFAKSGDTGCIYFDGKFWKICQSGNPQDEVGWNYSQLPGKSSNLPPDGKWVGGRKYAGETSRSDYGKLNLTTVVGKDDKPQSRKKRSKRRDRDQAHNGEWRDQSKLSNFCKLDSDCDGKKLCKHGGIIHDSHWSCCGSTEKDSKCTKKDTTTSSDSEEETKSSSDSEDDGMEVDDELVGKTVWCNFKGRGAFFRAKVTKKQKDGSYVVDYKDDSDTEKGVKKDMIETSFPRIDFKQLSSINAKDSLVGQKHLFCNWKGKGDFYPCSVKKKSDDGTYDVEYGDGDTEDSVPKSRFFFGNPRCAKKSGSHFTLPSEITELSSLPNNLRHHSSDIAEIPEGVKSMVEEMFQYIDRNSCGRLNKEDLINYYKTVKKASPANASNLAQKFLLDATGYQRQEVKINECSEMKELTGVYERKISSKYLRPWYQQKGGEATIHYDDLSSDWKISENKAKLGWVFKTNQEHLSLTSDEWVPSGKVSSLPKFSSENVEVKDAPRISKDVWTAITLGNIASSLAGKSKSEAELELKKCSKVLSKDCLLLKKLLPGPGDIPSQVSWLKKIAKCGVFWLVCPQDDDRSWQICDEKDTKNLEASVAMVLSNRSSTMSGKGDANIVQFLDEKKAIVVKGIKNTTSPHKALRSQIIESGGKSSVETLKTLDQIRDIGQKVLTQHLKQTMSTLNVVGMSSKILGCCKLMAYDGLAGPKNSKMPLGMKNQWKRFVAAFHSKEYMEMIDIASDFPERFVHKEVYMGLGFALEHMYEDCSDALAAYSEQKISQVDPIFILVAAKMMHQKGHSSVARSLIIAYNQIHQPGFQSEEDLEIISSISSSSLSSPSEEDETALELPSKARSDWETFKMEAKVKSEAMDKLVHYVGLERIKQEALTLLRATHYEQKLPERQRIRASTNFILLGNPGTGKSTVAKFIGKMLFEIGVRKKDVFKSIKGNKLKEMNKKETEKFFEEAMGGVVFIDEVPQLDPVNSPGGKAVLDVLLEITEDKRDEISVIIAGYEDEVENKILNYDAGLRSRFKYHWKFDDYNEKELRCIFMMKVRGQGWSISHDDVSLIASRRLAAGRGRKGFGNARDARNLFEKAANRSTVRTMGGGTELKKEDILGQRPDPYKNPLKSALAELEVLIGLKSVKNAVRELVELVQQNWDREMNAQKALKVPLNRLFIGNPGTGKTTVAEIWGRILKSCNLLSNGESIRKTPSDLTGAAQGEAAKKTAEVLDAAKGKVLILDEAHNLDDDSYGRDVLKTIVSKSDNKAGADIAVVMCGYERPMLQMLQNQDPGLKDRFNPDNAFRFEDFSRGELLEILKMKCKKDGLIVKWAALKFARDILAQQKLMPKFSNGRAVENLLGRAKLRLSRRWTSTLSAEDFEPENYKEMMKDPLLPLRKMHKTEAILEKLERLLVIMKKAKENGSANLIKSKLMKQMCYIFSGSPGTGKTTVAGMFGEVFARIGLLSSSKVVQTSGLKLQGQHVGHTKNIVKKVLEEAHGGVLFIDEAYELGRKSSYAQEAVSTLVDEMTQKENEGKMMIIVAGYKHEMEELMRTVNQGFSQRFKSTIEFPDWEPEDCQEFVIQKAEQDGFILPSSVRRNLHKKFRAIYTRNPRLWANARTATQIFENASLNSVYRGDSKRELTLADFSHAFTEMKKIVPVDGDSKIRSLELGKIQEESDDDDDDDDDDGPPLLRQTQSVPIRFNQKFSIPIGNKRVYIEDLANGNIGMTGGIKKKNGESLENNGDKESFGRELQSHSEEKKVNIVVKTNFNRNSEDHKESTQANASVNEKHICLKMSPALKRFLEAKHKKMLKDQELKDEYEAVLKLGECEAGFGYTKVEGGWRCNAGGPGQGSHFVDDDSVQAML